MVLQSKYGNEDVKIVVSRVGSMSCKIKKVYGLTPTAPLTGKTLNAAKIPLLTEPINKYQAPLAPCL